LGWIMQATKTRRYKKELLLLRKDRDEYEVRYRSGEEKQKALAKEIEALSREKVDLYDRVQGLEAERNQYAGLAAANDELKASIEELNTQVLALEAENERLLTTPQPAPEEGAVAGTGFVNESLNAYIAVNESRLQALEQRLNALVEENVALRNQGSTVSTGDPAISRGHTVQEPVPAPAAEPLVIRADTTEPGVRTGHQGGAEVIVQTTPSIQVPSFQTGSGDEGYDDLTRINNIGPFLQAELNKADIYRYEQIANWTEADLVTYTELIGYLPGIIQRDDWIGQAQRLLEEKEVTTSTTTPVVEEYAAEPAVSGEDDLKVVEGIGPKIESVLKEAGITTYDTLALTSIERLREVLDAAGSRFKSHDPKTWPVQAGLAADGKMEELKAWQQELK
ncbi:MAG: helix-hairpin-helix domain-containing protein, partial [Bacteroidota bacterium]